jgi:hypothetical protein
MEMKALALVLLIPCATLTVLCQTNSERGSVPNELRIAKLRTIIGKQLYACSDAKLFDLLKPSEPPSSGGMPKTLLDRRPRSKLLPFEIPILKPLTIADAVPVQGIGVSGLQDVNLLFEFASGRKVGADAFFPTTGPVLEGEALLKELTSRNANGLLLERPKWYRPETADMLQAQLPEKGMSRDELRCSVGQPEAINDYGDAGDQWVYDDGRTLVYFSSETGLILDVQHIGN